MLGCFVLNIQKPEEDFNRKSSMKDSNEIPLILIGTRSFTENIGYCNTIPVNMTQYPLALDG